VGRSRRGGVARLTVAVTAGRPYPRS
jgi:hypothetical protein